MMGRSHAIIGGLSAAVVNHATGADPAEVAVLVPVGVFYGLAPDLDHPYSQLGRYLPRWWHRATPQHRGVTHSLVWALAAALVAVACAALAVDGWSTPLRVGLTALVGGLSHLATDGITHSGVPWLYPWDRRHYTVSWSIRTGGPAEWVIVGVVTTVGVLLLGSGGA